MRKFCKAISVILVVLFVIMIPVNVVVRMFDNTISLLVAGNTFWELENADPNAKYFEGSLVSILEGRCLLYFFGYFHLYFQVLKFVLKSDCLCLTMYIGVDRLLSGLGSIFSFR